MSGQARHSCAPGLAFCLLLLAGCGGGGSSAAGGSSPTQSQTSNGPTTPPAIPTAPRFQSLGNVILQVAAGEGLSGAVAQTLTTGRGGRLSVSGDGSFVYRPALDFVGEDSVQYALGDGSSRTVTFALAARVRFVRSGAAPGATGYQDDPLDSIDQALALRQPGDILYVMTGTTSPIVLSRALPDGCLLTGAGVALQTDRVLLPASTHPRLQGQLTLGNDTLVSGLQLENPLGDVLVVNGRSNLRVTGNRFTALSGRALRGSDCAGTMDISQNAFADDNATDPLEGILLIQAGSTILNLTVNNNRWSSDGQTQSFDAGLQLLASGSAQTTLIARSNQLKVQGSGLNLQLSGSAGLNASISDNQFQQSQQEGIGVIAGTADSDSATSTLVASGNVFTDALGPGLLLRSRGTGLARQNWTVRSNQIRSLGNFGITLIRGNSSIVRASLSDNQVENASQAGIQVTSGTPSGGFTQPLLGEDHLSLSGNRITGAGGIVLSLISQLQATSLQNNNSSAAVSILARAATSGLQLKANQVGAPLEVTVESGFSLTYDNQGQSTPAASFGGGGVVVPGTFTP